VVVGAVGVGTPTSALAGGHWFATTLSAAIKISNTAVYRHVNGQRQLPSYKKTK